MLRDSVNGPENAGLSADISVPRHVAVILDGNRRWAAVHGRPLIEAYRLGALRVQQLLGWCDAAGVRYATVWALSQDNLGRCPGEVSAVLEAVCAGLWAISASRRFPVRIIGDTDQLPVGYKAQLDRIMKEAAGGEGTTLNVALAYCGRHDIVQAVQAMARHGLLSTGPGEAAATERLVSRYLSTAGQPDPELVIRTSGEQRLSGFMPWQTAHAELYFTWTTWPDFTRNDFVRALEWYAGRRRRFGR
ncbi:polyprenyl diphosphate synthase [Streptomyces gamaensis]|uniref:Isoprenyl transferase n=1 Tax=Streptomyces gamaensis TaxID=1763542 RepID=A0ABW0Z0B0_9ACTN